MYVCITKNLKIRTLSISTLNYHYTKYLKFSILLKNTLTCNLQYLISCIRYSNSVYKMTVYNLTDVFKTSCLSICSLFPNTYLKAFLHLANQLFGVDSELLKWHNISWVSELPLGIVDIVVSSHIEHSYNRKTPTEQQLHRQPLLSLTLSNPHSEDYVFYWGKLCTKYSAYSALQTSNFIQQQRRGLSVTHLFALEI